MIIAFCGLIGSGKNAAAEYLVSQHGYTQDSFAGPLKDAVAAIFGWDREALEGTTIESRAWRERVDPWWANRLNISHLTPRWVLQHWGTEVLRVGFHNDIWIASLEARINRNERTVISDCRFPNEVDVIRQLGGHVFKVQRGPDPAWMSTASRALNGDQTAIALLEQLGGSVHYSEYALANTEFEHVIDNNRDLPHLFKQIDDLIKIL